SNPALRNRLVTRPAVRSSWCDSSGCWWRSRYSCSCHALAGASPARTDETAGFAVMVHSTCPLSGALGDQPPPAVGQDVAHVVERMAALPAGADPFIEQRDP